MLPKHAERLLLLAVVLLSPLFAWSQTPQITQISPASGSAGTLATIIGSAFGSTQGGGSVSIGGVTASVGTWSDIQITATIPPGAPTGAGTVSVTNGSSVQSNAFSFTILPPNVFPGPVTYSYDELGRLVGVVATSGDAVRYSYDAVGNILSITRYSANQLALLSFTPKTGGVGTQVTISGSNFSATASQNAVSFNGTTATIISASNTTLVASVPAGATTGPISVTSPSGSMVSPDAFSITAASGAPRIDSFTPLIAASGSSVTVAGANFDVTPQNDRVKINNTTAALPTNVTSSSFQITVPTLTASSHITLNSPLGTATSTADLFIPPPGYSASQINFSGRANLGSTTTVSIGAANTIGLLIFEGQAGRSLSVSTSSPAFTGSCTLQMYKPDYSTLGSSSSCSSATFVDAQKLPVTGTYTVAIIPSASVTGSVAVTLNDSTDIVTSTTPNGPAVTLNISTPGQNVRATFAGSAGQQATAQFTANSLGSVTASLVGPDGTALATITSASSSFSLPTIMLPSNGQYTVLVDAPGATTGSVLLSVALVGGSRAVPVRPVGSLFSPGNALSQNMVGLFVMNEVTGTTTKNLVDNQTANFSGTTIPTWNTFDPSINFQGGSSLASYLDAGTDLNFDQLTPNKMTVVAKVFLSSVMAGGIAEKNDGNVSAGFGFGLDNTGAVVLTVVKASNMKVSTAAKTVTSGQWMQVAFTWDGTVNTAAAAHIYVNGIEQTKVSSTDGSTGTINASNATNKPFRIGNAAIDSEAGSLNGKIAYLAVYKYRVLTTTELNQLDAQLPITTDVVSRTNENGGPVSVSTVTPGQNAHVSFNGWANQQVTVQLSNNTMGAVNVSLLAPDGTTVTSTASSSASFNLPLAALPLTGTYDVLIHPTGSTNGNITVNLAMQAGGRSSGSVFTAGNALAQNLAGLFVMNEGTGTTDKNLVDNQVANFSGTSIPTWNTLDPSVNFQGGASLVSYLDAGTDLNFDQLTPNKMTVVAKVFLNTVAAGGIAEKNDGNVSAGFGFGLDNTGALVLTVVKASNMRVATAAKTVTGGQWMQVAFTWDGTVNTAAAAHIYVNGVEQTKVSSTDGTAGIINAANATNKPFRIGNAAIDTQAGSFNGKIAYLAVYKYRVLTTTELNQLDAQLPITTDIVSRTNENGGPVSVSTVTPGQNVHVSFNGWVNQQVTVQLSNNTMGAVNVSLIAPDGTTVTSAASSSASFTLSQATLPLTGTYDVLIHPTGSTNGNITVNLAMQGGGRSSGSVVDASNGLSQSLVGLFVMNEGTGTTDKNLVDNQMANFSGTSIPTWNTLDPSVNFQGGTSLASYLDAGTDLNFDQLTPNKMTVVAKVFLNTVAAGGIAEKNDGNTSAGFGFGLDNTGALVLTVVKASNMRVATAAKTVTGGQWMQVAFTWDGTVNTAAAAHIYVNGVEQTKVSSTDGSTGIINAANATNKPFRIGNAAIDTQAGSFNGKIAYLAVYRNRILTTTELVQLDTQLPINATDVTGTVTPNGSPVPITISSTGQNARFFFSATGGQNATVQLTNNTLGAVTVSLLNTDGTTLSTATSSAASFNVPPALIPVNGTYPVYIHPNSASSGSITLAVAVTNTPSRPTSSVLDSGNPLSTNLTGLFVMNEGTGTTDKNLVDSQLASFAGASAPTWNTTDPSVAFNGGVSQNSYLNAGTDLAFDQLPTSKVTIVAKVFVPSLVAGGIAEKTDNGASTGVAFGWDGTGAIQLTVVRPVANLTAKARANSIQAGQWIQVAFTWDGTVGTAAAVHLFVNGAEQTKVSSADGSGTIGYANATNQPFRIGNAYIAGALNGKMAYLAVYRGRILTTAEMSQLDAQLPVH